MPKRSQKDVASQLAALARQLDRLHKQLSSEDGTGSEDLPPRAMAEGTIEQRKTLDGKIRAVLTQQNLSTTRLAREISETVIATKTAIERLEKARQIYNVGTADHPAWTWRIGDEGSTVELFKQIVRLLSERPMSHRMLAEATGARFKRVAGIVIDLRRNPETQDRLIQTRASERRGGDDETVWFLLPGHMESTALPARSSRDRRGRGHDSDDES